MWPFKRKPLEAIALKLTDGELVDQIFDRLPKQMEDMSELELGVFNFWWLRAECRNGTIDQYFTNSTADDLPRLRNFLSACGSSELLDALRSITSIYADGDDRLVPRSERINISASRFEADEEEWEQFVRQENEKIVATFEITSGQIGSHIRSLLEKYKS